MKQRSLRQPWPLRKTAVVDFAVIDLAKAVIERVDVLAKTCGPTRAYVAVVASIGLAFVYAIATRLKLLAPFLLALYLPPLHHVAAAISTMVM
jgi:hypothetical protein